MIVRTVHPGDLTAKAVIWLNLLGGSFSHDFQIREAAHEFICVVESIYEQIVMLRLNLDQSEVLSGYIGLRKQTSGIVSEPDISGGKSGGDK